jgi:hypothetical protein
MNTNYSQIFSEHEAMMLQDVHNAISENNLWDWLKDYSPEDGKGFMFTSHPNLDRINQSMKYGGHSGSSYAWCMRIMERIAKDGWESVYNEYLRQKQKDDLQKEINGIKKNIVKSNEVLIDSALKVAELLKDRLPDGKEQYEAMKKFSEGKMSYAEMRGLCG